MLKPVSFNNLSAQSFLGLTTPRFPVCQQQLKTVRLSLNIQATLKTNASVNIERSVHWSAIESEQVDAQWGHVQDV